MLVVRRSAQRPDVLRDFGRLVAPHDDLTALARVRSPSGDMRSGQRIASAVRDLVRPAARG